MLMMEECRLPLLAIRIRKSSADRGRGDRANGISQDNGAGCVRLPRRGGWWGFANINEYVESLSRAAGRCGPLPPSDLRCGAAEFDRRRKR
jgi:hypothetical protein